MTKKPARGRKKEREPGQLFQLDTVVGFRLRDPALVDWLNARFGAMRPAPKLQTAIEVILEDYRRFTDDQERKK